MIERVFIDQAIKEWKVKEFLFEKFKRALVGDIKIYRTPLGDRVVIYCARPALIIGRKGMNLKKIATILKEKYGLENPQIDVKEIENPDLEPSVVALRIAMRLATLGPRRFRKIAYRTLQSVMASGARGVEIQMAGKLPGDRGKKWKFKKGYIPKSGYVAVEKVKYAFTDITLPPGNYGIKVWILTPDVKMPDEVEILDVPIEELKKRLEEKGIRVGEVEGEGSEKNE